MEKKGILEAMNHAGVRKIALILRRLPAQLRYELTGKLLDEEEKLGEVICCVLEEGHKRGYEDILPSENEIISFFNEAKDDEKLVRSAVSILACIQSLNA